MKGTYLLGIDQGTSATSAALYSKDGQLVTSSVVPLQTNHPQPGYVEQDPWEVVSTVKSAVWNVINELGLGPEEVTAIGLANQGESFVLWDIETGQPVIDSINWQDTRSTSFCEQLGQRGEEQEFVGRSGLPLDPEWPATKIPWVLEHVEKAAQLAKQGRLAYGQLDTWLIYNLTSGRQHLTDHSTACRSGLYNLYDGDWDPVLLDMFQAAELILPEIRDSASDFSSLILIEGWSAPLQASMLDQAASLLGQACIHEGDTKVTYGTCAGLWCNQGDKLKSSAPLSTSIAWQIAGVPTFAAAGEAGSAGSIVVWLQKKMNLPWSLSQLAEVANRASGQEQLIMVPAFTGLGAPHWVPSAMGTLYGLTSGVSLEHLVRAAFKAIAFQVRDLFDALTATGHDFPDTIKADGGMAKNSFLMQFQADILGKRVLVPSSVEGTSRGVALLAGLVSGVYPSINDIENLWTAVKAYEPRMPIGEREDLYGQWQTAIRNTIRTYQ